MSADHHLYMHRCLQLARLGAGKVAPNPMVGAVLVHEGRVIGEGFHRQYGGPHAEVNCLHSVKEADRPLIERSVLYVSLEPCAHYGKTPPCAALVIRHRIPQVVVGCRDPFPLVNGKGIEKLEAAGIAVAVGVLEEACLALNRRFFTFHTAHRPFIRLKWAQTGDRRLANADHSRVFISNGYTNRLVHLWRSEEAAIAVGTNTALFDDPALTTRSWPGASPVRIVVDLSLRLPSSLQLFDGTVPTIVFNSRQHTLETDWAEALHSGGRPGLAYYQVTEDVSLVQQVVHALYQLRVTSVLVEGGARLLQSFIDEGLWDEACIITNESLILGEGLPAPVLRGHRLAEQHMLEGDTITVYQPLNP